jgi:hypothetical protein
MEGTKMTSFATDPQIATIRKLLKKAEGAAKLGQQVEADVYNEKASELIAKYGIDQALLAASGEKQDKIISKRIQLSDIYTMDKRVLFNSIVKGLGAQVVFLRSHRSGTSRSYSQTAYVFAYESDMERIEFLFEMLQPQMLFGAVAAEVPNWENPRSFRKSWMAGFSAAIRDRLSRNEKKAAAAAGAGTDIVLYDRSKAVEDVYTLANLKTRTVTRSLNGTGRSQGYSAGTRANLGSAVGNGSRPALVG